MATVRGTGLVVCDALDEDGDVIATGVRPDFLYAFVERDAGVTVTAADLSPGPHTVRVDCGTGPSEAVTVFAGAVAGNIDAVDYILGDVETISTFGDPIGIAGSLTIDASRAGVVVNRLQHIAGNLAVSGLPSFVDLALNSIVVVDGTVRLNNVDGPVSLGNLTTAGAIELADGRAVTFEFPALTTTQTLLVQNLPRLQQLSFEALRTVSTMTITNTTRLSGIDTPALPAITTFELSGVNSFAITVQASTIGTAHLQGVQLQLLGFTPGVQLGTLRLEDVVVDGFEFDPGTIRSLAIANSSLPALSLPRVRSMLTLQLEDSTLPSVNLAALGTLSGAFIVRNTTLTDFSAPLLTSIGPASELTVQSNGALNTIDVPALTFVAASTLTIEGNSSAYTCDEIEALACGANAAILAGTLVPTVSTPAGSCLPLSCP